MRWTLGRRRFLETAAMGVLTGTAVGTAASQQRERAETTFTPNQSNRSVVQTPDGELLLSGVTETELPGYDGPTAVTAGWAQRRTLDGSVRWSRTYISPTLRRYAANEAVTFDQESEFDFVVADGRGGYLHVGSFFDGGSVNTRPWIVKTGGEGNKQWEREDILPELRSFANNLHDGVATADGYLLAGRAVGGQAYGNARGEGWVVSLSREGTVRWQRLYNSRGESYDSWGEDPTQDRFNAVVQTGNGTALLVGGTGGTRESASSGWVLEIGLDGQRAWQRTYDHGDRNLEFTDVTRVSDGYILVGATGPPPREVTGGYVLKVDENGTELWERTIDSRCRAVTKTGTDSFLAVGNAFAKQFTTDGSPAGEQIDPDVSNGGLRDGLEIEDTTLLVGETARSSDSPRRGIVVTVDGSSDDGGGAAPGQNTLSVAKADTEDGLAYFLVVTADGVSTRQETDGVHTGTAALDWLGPARGTDTYRVTGRPETFLLKGPAAVQWNDSEVDPERLGTAKPAVDHEALNRTVRVESTGTGYGIYAVTASGGIAPVDAEPVTDGYSAIDHVGPEGGVDEFQFAGEITRFLSSGNLTVTVDGEQVDRVET